MLTLGSLLAYESDFGLPWDHLGALCGHFGPTLRLLWAHFAQFGTTLGSLRGHLGSLWGHFARLGVSLDSLWAHFGLTLGSLWVTLGSLWGHFGVTLG